MTVDIPVFTPAVSIAAPIGTTHFKIISGGAEIDFENDSFVADIQEGAVLPWDSTPTAVLNLENSVTPNSASPLFLALGIAFYQEVNGVQYPLKNGAYNALALVMVSGV